MNTRLNLVCAAIVAALPAQAEPVDLTGLTCVRENNLGQQIWDFYGDVAAQYYSDGSPPFELVRVGEGAYQKYSYDGEWSAMYYFFDVGDGVQMRVHARPGAIIRHDNPRAPWQWGVFPFEAECTQLWDVEP